ncbi:thioredoxin-like protein, partial [Thozetella sp. PMI_491]
FTIDIYSDTLCPWCYIGKKHLDRAIETYREQNPDAEFSLSWKPFELMPNAKATELRKKAFFVNRLGSKAPAFFERLSKLAMEYGFEFEWNGMTGNTHDSHKLILLAMDQDAAADQHHQQTLGSQSPPPHGVDTRQDAVVMALFRGAFEQGRDISDRGFLVEVALQLGLLPDDATVLAWLDSPEANARVDTSIARAKAIGINGVPSFVVQDRYRVGGMQEPGIFLGLFDKIR